MSERSENEDGYSLTPQLQFFSKRVSLVIASVGLVIILGWVFDIAVLKSILTNRPTMKVNTALCFVLGGASLWLWHWKGNSRKEKGEMEIQRTVTRETVTRDPLNSHHRESQGSASISRWFHAWSESSLVSAVGAGLGARTWSLVTDRWLLIALAFLMTTIALLTLIQYGFHLSLGIDEFLIQQPEPQGSTAAPGRMAPNTALAFLLEGSALLLLSVRRPNYLAAQGMAVGAGLIGYLGLLGYVQGSPYFYTAGSFTGMAIHTASCLLLLSSGILCARPDQGLMRVVCSDRAGGLMARRLLPLAIVLPPLVSGLCETGYRWYLYSKEAQMTLSNASDIILFSALIGWSVHRLNRFDSHRRRTELELQASQARFAGILENANDGIISVDTDQRITLFNQGAEKIFGYAASEVLGQPLDLLLSERLVSAHRQHVSNFGESASTARRMGERKELFGRRKDGTEFPAEASISKLKIGDEIIFTAFVRDITEQKRAQKALRLSEERLQLALEASNDGLWDWNIEAGEIYLSPRWIEMLGYEWDELPQEVSTWERVIHPDDKPWVLDRLNAHLKDSSVSYAFDYRLRTKSGEWKWVADYGKVVARDENGLALRMTGTHKDISDRKRAEASLQRYERIVSATTDAICLLDRNYTYQLVNQAYLTLQDKPLDEIIGHSVSEILGADIFETFMKPRLERCLAGEVVNYQRWFDYLTLGRQFMGVTYAPYLEANHTISGVVVSLRNLTELKQAELELQRAKEAAEVANRAKSIFLANMSHELRTPLNVILGFAQVMNRDSLLTKEQQANLEIISKSGNHLLTLINDVLDLSKIEAGRITLDESSFDVIGLVRSLQEMLRQKAEKKGLQLNLEIATDLPQYVTADPNKLRQVLLNLLSNAIKFTQEGSVTLKVKTQNSNVKNEAETPTTNNQKQTTITFEVSDTGVGIIPTELDSIFDAFVQTQAGKASNEGTGLGLTISHKFVQLMGSNLTVKSTLGQGSTFSFEIPVRQANASEVQPPQTHHPVVGLAPGQPSYRILIVDDQPENRQLLVKLLTQLGLEVREATNGQEAITLWQEWQPHLIWMDIRMPVMDGYEASQHIRSSEEGQSTVIIALTAQASNSDRALALKAGCNDYISKPFQEEELFAKMAEHLGLRYIYASSDQQEAVSIQDTRQADSVELTPESLSMMPSEWINKLHEAAQLCDDEEILHLIEQIPSEHSSLVANLRCLAHYFQFSAIAQLTSDQ